MSTLWEMATSIRDDRRERITRSNAPNFVPRQAANVDLQQPDRIDYWCRLLGTTPWRLCCAVDHVGTDPTAIRRYLGRSGASARAASRRV